MEPRYFARSASDKSEDWPAWFVADRSKGGLNVTYRHTGAIFLSRKEAEELAGELNRVPVA